jgi:Holliday junction resolvase RusA-like endonuclease
VSIIDTWIPGEPLPMARPRFDSRSRRSYTDARSEAEQNRIKWLLKAERPRCALEGALEVRLLFRRTTRSKVDVDNLAKMVLDAAKGIVWHDDHQVHRLVVVKVLGVGRELAGTRFIATALLPLPPAESETI